MSKAVAIPPERPRILLVDDQQANLLAFEVLLDEFDAVLLRANSGNEALKMILNHPVALVLLDVQMPGMDGFEVAELMQKTSRSQGIPIIFVTAINHDMMHVLKGYENGAADFLTKPVEPLMLRSKVRVFLDLYRKNRELEISNAALQGSMRELARLKEHNEMLLRSLGEGVLRLDAEGRIVYANPAATALLGDDVTGSLLSTHLAGDEEEELVSEMLAQCMAGECWHAVAAARRLDAVFAADLTATAIMRDDGIIDGVSVVFTDASRHQRLQKKMAAGMR